ncbi:MAG: hypothetical protein IKS20_13095 [Victivallales bacterium]|nr:hypothetical protein [Victivallales bacterium]
MSGKSLIIACLAMFFACFAEDIFAPIPFKQDPPIQIDGVLDDWHDVPVVYELSGRQHLLPEDNTDAKWRGASDFSGKVILCWKPNGLYLAADVMDDSVSQKHGGSKLFYGDHIELFLDTTPLLPGNKTFGKGQFHIGISPGDFETVKPELYCFFPEKTLLKETRYASARTESGWCMEVYLPWKAFGLPEALLEGTPMNIEIWLSDTDAADDSVQKCVMTTGSIHWKFRMREGMRRFIMTDANGAIRHNPYNDIKSVKLYDTVTIGKESSQKQVVKLASAPAGTVHVLSMKARLNSSMLNGYASALKIYVNGKEVAGEKLYNRPLTVENKKGVPICFYDKLGFVVPYTGPDDFYSGNQKGTWLQWFKRHVNLHDFEFDISFATKEGDNEIEISNNHKTSALSLKDVQISLKMPRVVRKRREAPTGTLPLVCPKERHKIDYTVMSPENPLRLKLGANTWEVRSMFSTPDGKWASGSNQYFAHRRILEQKAEAVIVKDVFTNLTDEPLPLMQRHEITISGADKKFYINGLEAIPSNEKSQSFNASSFGASKDG